MGKAKPAKHTSAELAAKTAASLTNKGGGAAGKTDRLGGKVWQDWGMLEDVLCLCHLPCSDLNPHVYLMCPSILQAGSHAKYKCHICAQMVPDMKTMQVRLLKVWSTSHNYLSIWRYLWCRLPL